ncbi:hypothetical protein [Pseudoxanthomonas sp. CF125]|uniref:hypothetical protein n=1 Tax=Pseudoxanthomonas sp. CF125 TaxID=1855303 RepID=UPI000887E8CA|nr:hypothetical protein [Pseudoxanthomonas sp. CF125]SDQ42949.1 hypothetical protein SAMN05216569_1092 [Pseudoxanthomonas sp. CF125]
MPNRIIRETILTSDKVDELDSSAEVFYRRLLSKVDDYGRYDARPSILRSMLFPLRVDRVREADCTRWMAACQKAGLIALYSHAGKPFLECSNTEWQKRSPSKYPPPTNANICAQVQTNAHLVVDVDVDVSVVVENQEQVDPPAAPPPSVTETKGKNGSRLPDDWKLPDDWAAWAKLERPDLDIPKQGEKFADHWQSLPGARARKTDWQKTWRNWIRGERAAPPGTVGTSRPQTNTPKQAMAPSESPLERACNWARQQCHNGQIDETERDRLIAAATAKHRGES